MNEFNEFIVKISEIRKIYVFDTCFFISYATCYMYNFSNYEK